MNVFMLAMLQLPVILVVIAASMLVIFIGVLGGFLFSGFIGLFTGAVVISIGYKLFISWINSPNTSEPA